MPALPVQTCGVGVSRNMYFMSYNKIVHFFIRFLHFFIRSFGVNLPSEKQQRSVVY